MSGAVTVGKLVVNMAADVAQLKTDVGAATAVVEAGAAKIQAASDLAKGALIGMAMALGPAAVTGMVKSAIEAAAGLQALSEKTGATVEGLSAMRGIAKLTGTSLDEIAGGMTKLAKNMSTMDDAGKESSRALAALGLEASKIRNMHPDEAMKAIADAMGGFQDGASKSAIAMALFGKAGAQLLPFMKDMAAAGELHAKVTSEQALQADEFEKNLIRLSVTGKGWEKELAMGMLPALNDFSEAMLKAVNGAGGLRDEVKKLSEEGSIDEWARECIDNLLSVANAADGAWRVFKQVKLSATVVINDISAANDLLGIGFFERFTAEGQAKIKAIIDLRASTLEKLNADTEANLSGDLLGTRIRSGMEKVKQAQIQMTSDYVLTINTFLKDFEGFDAEFLASHVRGIHDAFYGAEKQQAPFAPKAEKDESISKARDAYDNLIKSIKEKIAVQEAELAGDDKLSAAEKDYTKFLTDVTAGYLELTPAQMTFAAVLFDSYIATTKANSAQREAKKAMDDYRASLEAYLKPLEAEADALDLQIQNYGKGRQEIERATVARLESALAIMKENGALAEAIAAQEREIEARKRIADDSGTVAALQQQTDFWKSIGDTAHQTWVSIADGGKNTWQRLKETGKNIFFEWLYQMTVKKWLFNFVASVSGTGVAQSAFGAQGGGGLGAIGSIGNAVSGGSSLINAFTGGTNSVFSSIGTSSLLANTGIGSGLQYVGANGVLSGLGAVPTLLEGGEFMTALGAALPGIGTVIAAIAMITSLMGKGGGPKTEGDYFGTLGATGTLTQSTTATGGSAFIDDHWYTAHSADAQMAAAAPAIGASIYQTVKSLGGDATGMGINYGYNTDPQGTAPDNVAAALTDKNGSYVYKHVADVERGKSSDAMALEFQRMTLAAIGAADGIKPVFKAIVDGVDLMTASADQMTAALKQVTDAKTVLDYATADPFADYATAAATASQSLMQSWGSQQTALSGLLATYDGSALATAALADKTKTLYQTELAIAQQIDQVRATVSGSTDSSIHDYRMSVLDNQGKYDFLDKEAAGYLQQIKDATDPTKIAQYSASLATDRNAAWGLLDDGQKKVHLDEFVQRAQDDQTIVNASLDKAATLVTQGHQDLSNVITSAMDRAAAALVAAANRISTAADKPVVVTVNTTGSGAFAGNEVSVSTQ